MDLGISGKTAIVCGSSQGLGHACALALAEAGVNVVINGRDAAKLDAAAAAIEAHADHRHELPRAEDKRPRFELASDLPN